MATLSRKQETFDYSLDALDFKQRLHQQLMEKLAASSVEPVDDDDLTWINAAGNPHQAPDEHPRCMRKPPSGTV